jgi:hypothetical protein
MAYENFQTFSDILTHEKVANVPIINHFSKIPISVLQEVLVPLQTLFSLTCTDLDCNDATLYLKNQKDLVLFQINSIFLPNLKSPDALLTFPNFQNIQIPILNASMEDILIQANSKMALINILDKTLDIFQINISIDQSQDISINSTETTINDHKGLDESE